MDSTTKITSILLDQLASRLRREAGYLTERLEGIPHEILPREMERVYVGPELEYRGGFFPGLTHESLQEKQNPDNWKEQPTDYIALLSGLFALADEMSNAADLLREQDEV